MHDRLRQLDVDDLGPEVARHVDLRRRRAAPRLLDHPVQHLGDPHRVAHLLLVADHVAEQRHLLDLLEAALADRPVRRLRRHQEERRVVPVRRLHRRHEVGDPRPVLRDRHRHPPGRPRVAVRHHPGVALVGAVPEGDARRREQVRDRHHRRADDPEGMGDPMPLQHLHEGLFRRHPHRMCSLSGRKPTGPPPPMPTALSARASSGRPRYTTFRMEERRLDRPARASSPGSGRPPPGAAASRPPRRRAAALLAGGCRVRGGGR